MKRISCRIEYIDNGSMAIRLPAEDICRIHMQLELLKRGKLNNVVLHDAAAGDITVDKAVTDDGLLESIIDMLEDALMAYGDISWMHMDAEVSANGQTTDVSVGFF